MKSENIIKRLKKEGYEITYKKWSYWDGVPHVEFDTFSFAIAEHTSYGNSVGCNLDFIFNHVQEALYIAKKNNPIFLRKIKEDLENSYYMMYLIESMDDYYLYKKGVCPLDNYHKVLEKLKKELELR